MPTEFPYSKSRVTKAGKLLRRAIEPTDPAPSQGEIDEATQVLRLWRLAHRAALNSARKGLESCIRAEGVEVLMLGQRLKRLPTVLDKLLRQPNMNVAQMRDIAGCRAVLLTQADVDAVVERFVGNSARRRSRLGDERQDRVIDYARNPRDSGYRAIHIVTEYQGRSVEVQVRTALQHVWADSVELLSGESGTDFKSSKGEAQTLDDLREGAEALAKLDRLNLARTLMSSVETYTLGR